jgi:hypothetical protein
MSHKTEIKTELNNGHYLKQALQKLGFTFTEAQDGKKLHTKGHYGVHEEVDIRIEGNGSQNFDGAVGFKKKEDGTYTAVGDFYGLRTQSGDYVSADMLKCEVTAHSKESEINDRLMQLGFVSDPATRKETKEFIEISFSRNQLGI